MAANQQYRAQSAPQGLQGTFAIPLKLQATPAARYPGKFSGCGRNYCPAKENLPQQGNLTVNGVMSCGVRDPGWLVLPKVAAAMPWSCGGRDSWWRDGRGGGGCEGPGGREGASAATAAVGLAALIGLHGRSGR